MAYNSAGPVVFAGVSAVTATRGANDPQVGTRATIEGETYVYVYNEGGEQIQPSYAAVLDASSATSGYSVTISSVSGVDMMIGVCKHATITTGAYGWLMEQGFVNVEMEADNSGVTGAILALAANGEFAAKSNSTGYAGKTVGQMMESIASAASGLAYISVY